MATADFQAEHTQWDPSPLTEVRWLQGRWACLITRSMFILKESASVMVDFSSIGTRLLL